MCDYCQVEYACGHLRFTVRAWCLKYQETHKRCPPNVVAIEYRLNEKCGDCRARTAAYPMSAVKRSSNEDKKTESAGSSAEEARSSK